MYKKARRPKDKQFPDLPHMREIKSPHPKAGEFVKSKKLDKDGEPIYLLDTRGFQIKYPRYIRSGLRTTIKEEDKETLRLAKKTQARHESHQERVKKGKSMKDFRRDLYSNQNA